MEITYPQSGSSVEGIVEILGSIPPVDFSSARLSYSYEGEVEENWFLIAQIDQPIQNDVLANWDTTTITDGIYQVKLTVKTTGGDKQEVLISDIRVANYTRLATQPVNEETEVVTQTPVFELSDPATQAPTALPINPATINNDEIYNALFKGAMAGMLTVVLIVIGSGLHSLRRRR